MGLDPSVWSPIFPELAKSGPSTIARPILGFRFNRLSWTTGAPLALISLGPAAYVWQPGPNIAKCVRPVADRRVGAHQAPAALCRCGLYGLHSLSELRQVLDVRIWSKWTGPVRRGQPVFDPDGRLVVVGVAGSGIVRIHERGWRAQFARIVAIADTVAAGRVTRLLSWGSERSSRLISKDRARMLRERYDVPIVPLDELPEAMRGAGDFATEMPWT